MKNAIKILIVFLTTITFSCEKEKLDSPANNGNNGGTSTTKSSGKDITKFSFAALSPAVEATIDATAKTVSATVPAATDLTKLVPTITISDKATVSPATSVAQDFSKEVSYNVTAEDASTVVWKVNVKKETVVSNNSTCRIKTIKGNDEQLTSSNYEYNAKNLLVKMTISIYGTTITDTETYKYDANDNVTDYSYVSYDYTTNQIYAYQNGKRISEIGTYKVSGDTKTYNFSKTYEYDSNGNLIKINDNGVVYVYNNGKTISITDPAVTYQLNGQGLVTKYTVVADGSYYVYTYNADRLQTKREIFDKNGKRTESRVREYTKGIAPILNYGTNNNDLNHDEYGTFNIDYQLEKITTYTVNESNIETKQREALHTYSSKGNLLTYSVKDGSGKSLYTFTYTYEGCENAQARVFIFSGDPAINAKYRAANSNKNK